MLLCESGGTSALLERRSSSEVSSSPVSSVVRGSEGGRCLTCRRCLRETMFVNLGYTNIIYYNDDMIAIIQPPAFRVDVADK